MIQMHVQRRQHVVEMIVLQVGKFVAQHPDMMIVDKRDCPHHLTLGLLPHLFNQFIANQIAKGLRPVGVAALRNQRIELLEQVCVDSYADAAQFAHFGLSPEFQCSSSGANLARVARIGESCYLGHVRMHIPDGFLSLPVWLSLDVTAAAAAALMARRAEPGLEDGLAPRLGVLGAFVFAAQMINFPVAAGTSSHLIGGALLTAAVGPAAASLVLTAILAVQSLVFQDGGLLALGANIVNMAVVGVLAASIPLRSLASHGNWRHAGLFLAGAVSMFSASAMAIAELRLSGVAMSPGVLRTALGVFAVSAILEGLITVAVFEALETLNPSWAASAAATARATRGVENRALGLLGVAAVVLASGGALLASSLPDGLEKFAEQLGIAEQARALVSTPLADYEWQSGSDPVIRKVTAGLAGLAIIYLACHLVAKFVLRRRSS